MNFIIDILTFLGQHVVLVIVGCLELVAGCVLLGCALHKKSGGYYVPAAKGWEKVYLDEVESQQKEACLIVRKKDLMPVYGAGDFTALLGVGMNQIRDDFTCLKRIIVNKEEQSRVWSAYENWDGMQDLHHLVELENGKWIRMTIHRKEEADCDIFFFRDETQTQSRMMQYEEQLRQTEDASQSKSTFLSRMSHEIRTPLNGIMGMLTLAEGKLDADSAVMQYLSKADELSAHLLSLINDILDMSRIEAGKVELEQKVFHLRRFGERLYDMFVKNIDTEHVKFAVDFEDVTVQYVVGDELRIGQIVINFLSNAVKFTKQGEITVTFRQMLLQDGMVDIMIRVHDTGIGMDPDFIHRIFRPFEQEDMEISKRYGGTGLGMAITDQLVKLMGGEIVVESMPGQGTDFSVFLHLPVASNPGAEMVEEQTRKSRGTTQSHAFRNRRILLAEDNEINAQIAREILENMGAEVDVVENGQLALDSFSAHPAHYYDVILMDVQMPVMNGREAARRIRALPREDAASVLIFALSADAFVEDERLSLESGMNGHFAKPVNFVKLQETVGEMLNNR